VWEQAALSDYTACVASGATLQETLGNMEYERGQVLYQNNAFHLSRRALTAADVRLAALVVYHESSGGQFGQALNKMLAWVVFNRLAVIEDLYGLANLYDATLRQGWSTVLDWLGSTEESNLLVLHAQLWQTPAYRAVWRAVDSAAWDYTEDKADPVNGAIEAQSEPQIVISHITPQGYRLAWQDALHGLLWLWREIGLYFSNSHLQGVANYLMMRGIFIRLEPSGALTLVNWRFSLPDGGADYLP